MKRIMTIALFALLAVLLVACGNKEKVMKEPNQNHTAINQLTEAPNLPVGLKVAKNPQHTVGSKVILHSDYYPSMNGAEATIVGAYDTTAYAVTYKPIKGGPEVKNYKWIIHEELKDPIETPYAVGDQVVLVEDHGKSMKGATAIIDEVKPTTVYIIDYKTTTGEEVKNYKWITEDEITVK